MIIHNKTILDYYFESLNRITNRRGLLLGGIKRPDAKNADEVYISPQAKRAQKNADIEAQLQSGEPMKGVTLKEYQQYYRDKWGCYDKAVIEREYREALKGDKSSLREREWRTNPEYSIPIRIYSSPEVTADREAALEKYRNGGELSEWEIRIMHTFPNGKEGCDRINEAQLYRETTIYENKIAKIISDAGIELSENDELHFEVWGHDMVKVTGSLPEETLEKISTLLADKVYGLQSFYDRHDNTIARKQGGFPLMYLQEAENYLKGTGVSVFDISKDRNGNFVGLPDDMNKFIKEYAVGEFGITDVNLSAEEVKVVKKAQLMRETFNSAIDTVQKGKYDMYKAMTRHITLKNGKLEF